MLYLSLLLHVGVDLSLTDLSLLSTVEGVASVEDSGYALIDLDYLIGYSVYEVTVMADSDYCT